METTLALRRELVEQGRADIDAALGASRACINHLAGEGLATVGDLDVPVAKRVLVGVGHAGSGHVCGCQGDDEVRVGAADAAAAQTGRVEGHVAGAGGGKGARLEVLDGGGEGQGEGGEDDGGELHVQIDRVADLGVSD